MRSLVRTTITLATLVAALTVSTAELGAQPLRRDIASYHVLGMRKVSLKNYKLDSPCNVGVNCGGIANSRSCGVLALADPTFALGSQTVADQCFFRKPGGRIGQLFCNQPDSLANVEILQPPVQTFAPSIIANTCGPDCALDVAAMEAACGFPSPFPTCNAAAGTLKIAANSDCPPLDTTLGNGVCDLPPGAYGDINVLNGGKVALSPGNYAVCSFKVGRNARVQGSASIILVDGGGFKANNNTDIGQDCGDLEIYVKGEEAVGFGRNMLVAAKVCAPGSILKLGHNNLLIGQFIGDIVNSDLNNRGVCCAGRCACYDQLSPTSAKVGATVTATGACEMDAVSEVRVCGLPAAITSKTPLEVKFTVPAVGGPLPKQCKVEFVSPAGTYEGFLLLSVIP